MLAEPCVSPRTERYENGNDAALICRALPQVRSPSNSALPFPIVGWLRSSLHDRQAGRYHQKLSQNCMHLFEGAGLTNPREVTAPLSYESCTHLLKGDVLNRVPKREGACEQLVHEHANAPQVCGGPIFLHDDLRRHVDRCSASRFQLPLPRPVPASHSTDLLDAAIICRRHGSCTPAHHLNLSDVGVTDQTTFACLAEYERGTFAVLDIQT